MRRTRRTYRGRKQQREYQKRNSKGRREHRVADTSSERKRNERTSRDTRRHVHASRIKIFLSTEERQVYAYFRRLKTTSKEKKTQRKWPNEGEKIQRSKRKGKVCTVGSSIRYKNMTVRGVCAKCAQPVARIIDRS